MVHPGRSTANGYNSDLVAAIDQAVADGVDVINYSVSGTSTDFLDPAESPSWPPRRGIFVSAAGGNSGPAADTVAHPSPWVTTVAAGTHNRTTQGKVTLGNGTTYSGPPRLPRRRARRRSSTPRRRACPAPTRRQAAQCWAARDNGGTAVLDPAKIKGKIVICDRGVTPRVNKSVAVAEAGGLGVILTNVDDDSLYTDLQAFPPCSCRRRTGGRQGLCGHRRRDRHHRAGDGQHDAPAPYVAEFSSRGPLNAGGGDVLKPDVIAPGQDILAAFSPPGTGSTSTCPAVRRWRPAHRRPCRAAEGLHPDWSPMAIKSALMTSGTDVLDGPADDPSVIFGRAPATSPRTTPPTPASSTTAAPTTGSRSSAARPRASRSTPATS